VAWPECYCHTYAGFVSIFYCRKYCNIVGISSRIAGDGNPALVKQPRYLYHQNWSIQCVSTELPLNEIIIIIITMRITQHYFTLPSSLTWKTMDKNMYNKKKGQQCQSET